MWLLVLCSVLIFLLLIVRNVKISFLYKTLIAFFILSLWNHCALSETNAWLFTAYLLILCIVIYKYRKIKILLLSLLIPLVLIPITLTTYKFYLSRFNENKNIRKDAIDSKVDIKTPSFRLVGIHMGDGYKSDYNAIQGSTIYKEKLYQFFNNGYYEVRNADNMQLEYEGHLDLPVDIHYGSVQFAEKINVGCTMPYLYATDDASCDGNVYVIDFERQKVLMNYNLLGGSVAAYDFSKKEGYIINTDDNVAIVTPFDLTTGTKKKSINIQSNCSFETLQTAVFHNGYVYVLSGKTGNSLIITKVDVDNLRIVARKDYCFDGEPEGMFFRSDGDIVVTAAVGSWTQGKGTDRYIHSEYVTINVF